MLIYYITASISLNNGGLYIDSPEWIKNKKATINPQNKDHEYFKYAITAALNHKRISNHPEKISKIKPFIDKYNWKDIEFPSHSKDSEKFEQNNEIIALNILFVPYNTKQIRSAYISKYNHERHDKVNLLMITNNDENWHYLAVKSLSRLFKRITSNHYLCRFRMFA